MSGPVPSRPLPWRALARALLVAVAALLSPRAARAQGNSYAAPIGGRSALMGNTGVALGVDGAAPFLNPATIVRLDDQRFSFSVNVYGYSLNHLSNWHQPGPVDTKQFGDVALSGTSLSSSQLGGVPSTLCLFFTLVKGSRDPKAEMTNLDTWRQKLAMCIGTTESQGVSFAALPFTGSTPAGETSQSQSLTTSWNRLHIGPSYTVAISRRLAVGLSLHGVYTTESYVLDSSSITSSLMNGGSQSSLGIFGQGNSLDVSGIVGAIYSAAPYTFGASITLPSVHLLGSYTGSTHEEYQSGSSGSSMISNGTGSFSAAPPVRFALGAGVQWPRITLELDEALNIPAPTGFKADVSGTTSDLRGTSLTTTPFSTTYRVDERVVATTSVGTEVFVKRDFSVLGGASLNLTALPPLAPTANVGNLVQERESTATLSAGVGNYSTHGNLLLGFQLGYSWGSSLAVNPYVTPNQLAVIDTQAYSVLLILAGSTSLQALSDAAENMGHMLTGTPETVPKPTPPGQRPTGRGDPEEPLAPPDGESHPHLQEHAKPVALPSRAASSASPPPPRPAPVKPASPPASP